MFTPPVGIISDCRRLQAMTRVNGNSQSDLTDSRLCSFSPYVPAAGRDVGRAFVLSPAAGRQRQE